MPPKVIFKLSETVVAHRVLSLDSFLGACIENCGAYGTQLQDLLFRFLDAYDRILEAVELDDATVATMNELRASYRQGKSGGRLIGEGCVEEEEEEEDRDDDTFNGQDAWKAPLAAAILTAWVVVGIMTPVVLG